MFGVSADHHQPLHARLSAVARRFPRLGLAWRTALAALVSLLLAGLLPVPMSERAYFAPLGAVMTMSFSATGSLRDAVRALLAVVAGGALGALANTVAGPGPVAVGCVVAIGVLIAGWQRFGSMGSWVPTTGMYVILIGATDPVEYVTSYASLVILGGLIGVATMVAAPQMPMTLASRDLVRLRHALATKVAVVAKDLATDPLPSAGQWRSDMPDLSEPLWAMRSSLQMLQQTRRWNWRGRTFAEEFDGFQRQADALERAIVLVDDLALTIADRARTDADPAAFTPLGDELRTGTVEALDALHDLFLTNDPDAVDRQALDRATHAVDRLRAQIENNTDTDLRDWSAVIGVVSTVERIAASRTPGDIH